MVSKMRQARKGARQPKDARRTSSVPNNAVLSEISGNVRRPAPKRTIEDYFGVPTKRQRQDEPTPASPSPSPSPTRAARRPRNRNAIIDSDDEEDWAHEHVVPGEDVVPEEDCTDDDFVPEEGYADEPELAQFDGEDLADSAPELEQPVVDENGWIRVGPQPVAREHDVLSSPLSMANETLRAKLKQSSRTSDSKVPGVDSATVKEDSDRLLQELGATLVEHTNGNVKRLCDYTGLDLSWSRGPKLVSLEAVYPFTSQNGSLRYHVSPNAHLIMTALNVVKRRYPIAVLPLLAVILNADALPDAETQQSEIAWAFNALCNTASMHSALGTVLPDKVKCFKRWAELEEAKQRDMLEAFRTGRRTPLMDDVLSETTPEYLFRPDNSRDPTLSFIQRQDTRWDREYPALLRIAAAYGLSSDEFEFYLTIPSKQPGKRVFYPFHVLSRPQARTIGWNWRHLARLAARMLKTMRKFCNKRAEAKGLGDKGMNETRLVYWMAAHFSSQIQTIKENMPTAPREEIRFRILDRWGLPIVPWTGNVLCASLCKGPDHGIAMKFGITEPAGLESFDPVRHIDLGKCTVTIDTVATNMGMWDHHPDLWSGIREILRAVPLRHALWRIDDSAGRNIWGAASDPTIDPIAPIPSFDVPLIPIDAWFSGLVLRPTCDQCNLEFQNLGLLVQHCRNAHGSGANAAQDAPPSAEQDAMDAEYWQGFKCSWTGCDRVFAVKRDLNGHMRVHTGERPYACDWPGCDYAGKFGSNLVRHKRTHIPDMKFACNWPGCDYVAGEKSRLTAHKRTHTGERSWVCDWPGCGKAFSVKFSLDKHKTTHNGGFPCDQPDCDQICTDAGNLMRHKDRKHPGWRDREVD